MSGKYVYTFCQKKFVLYCYSVQCTVLKVVRNGIHVHLRRFFTLWEENLQIWRDRHTSTIVRWHTYIPVPFSGDIHTYQYHSQVTYLHTSTILRWHTYIPVPFLVDIYTLYNTSTILRGYTLYRQTSTILRWHTEIFAFFLQ